MSYGKIRFYKFTCYECGKKDEESRTTLSLFRVDGTGRVNRYLCRKCYWKKQEKEARKLRLKLLKLITVREIV